MEGFIRPFSAIGKHDAGIAGGKGASLGEMTQAGIPVPPGFVVLAPAFDRFLEETDLNVEIDAILSTVKNEEMHTVEYASEKIQGLILAAKMPADIGEEVKKHFAELGAEFVAVRSSATAEDGASAAWAGQLDTYLNTTEAELLTNVQRCWASLFTPRAIFYRFEKGFDSEKVSVAVVVQKMVNSDASGIAFSVHPVTEDRNQLIIEAGWGLGEAIVSGQITPDSYVVTKAPREILDKNIATKERGMFRKEGGGNDWKEIEKARQEEQTLSDAQILEFTELIMGIENHYGFPCDIEWAMEAGVMYITQSRPITTLSPIFSDAPSSSGGGASNPVWEVLAKDYHSHYLRSVIWTRGVNRGYEKVPELSPAKPLAMRVTGTEMEYLYKPAEWKQMHEEISSVLDNDISRLRTLIEATNTLGARAEKRGREIFSSNLTSASTTELVAYVKELSDLQEELYAYGMLLPLLDFGEQSFFEKRVRALLAHRDDAEDAFLLLTSPSEESFALQQEKALLELVAAVNDDRELKETILAKREDVFEVLQSNFADFYARLIAHAEMYRWAYYAFSGPPYTAMHFLSFIQDQLTGSSEDPRAKLGRLQDEQNELNAKKANLIEEIGTDASMRELLSLAGTFVWAKPTRKDFQSALYFYLIEGVLAEVMRRTGMSRLQALSCPFNSLEAILEGKEADRATITSLGERHVVFPTVDGTEVFYGSRIPEALAQIREPERKDLSGVRQIKGVIACKGFAKGIVRIINTPEDMHKMRQGDILVSFATAPTIVPAMQKAAAFVTDEGGLTSHAAIVAREMKKPCIIGTKFATQVLADGDVVEVDADAGVVRKIGGEKQTVLEKMYSREKPLFYFALWQADDREGMKRYLDIDIKDDLYIIPPPGTQGSIWFPKEDFEHLMKVAFEKINESHEFAESLIAHARKYWALVRPYLVEKKRCDDAAEMYEYYRNLVEFWIPMNSVFFMLPDRPSINPVFKEGILTLRMETQEYTEEMPRVFTDFFAKRFPSLAHLAYYIRPEETLVLDKELAPALIEELETRARDGCFMFGSGIYPMSKLAGMLTDSNLVFEKLEGNGQELAGQIAYKGKVSGPACLVFAKGDMAKVKKGDVLVTPMTNPDMVPVMKIAAAVVTDEGGLTCHAAIVSREMKVPCVVGTRVATQVFKDGDLVEVDADNGIVRKI